MCILPPISYVACLILTRLFYYPTIVGRDVQNQSHFLPVGSYIIIIYGFIQLVCVCFSVDQVKWLFFHSCAHASWVRHAITTSIVGQDIQRMASTMSRSMIPTTVDIHNLQRLNEAFVSYLQQQAIYIYYIYNLCVRIVCAQVIPWLTDTVRGIYPVVYHVQYRQSSRKAEKNR